MNLVTRIRYMIVASVHLALPDLLRATILSVPSHQVSDPIMFGHCVSVFYKPVFDKYADLLFTDLKVNLNNGLGDVYDKIAGHPKQNEIEDAIKKCEESRPEMAMVNSRKGITNLHVPSDVIVDASMAAAIRDGGKMWDRDDQLKDAKFLIPDRCYAGIYQAIIEDCKVPCSGVVVALGRLSWIFFVRRKRESDCRKNLRRGRPRRWRTTTAGHEH